jgi:hypothetical protein
MWTAFARGVAPLSAVWDPQESLALARAHRASHARFIATITILILITIITLVDRNRQQNTGGLSARFMPGAIASQMKVRSDCLAPVK